MPLGFQLFLSPNMTIGSLSTEALGTAAFGLEFYTRVIIIVIFCVFGMRTGLRYRILSRFLVRDAVARVVALDGTL